MLGWAIIFFIVMLTAAVFGFSGIAAAAVGAAGTADTAKIVFFVCLGLLAATLALRAVLGPRI